MFNEFAIGNEDEKYILHTLGEASGSAGDSLLYHRGTKFTTFDRDNDLYKDVNCGWWYKDCQNRSKETVIDF